MLLLLGFCLIHLSFAEKEKYPSPSERNGLALIDQSSKGVQFVFSYPGSLDFTDLPKLSTYIAIPKGSEVSFSITSSATETLDNFDLSLLPDCLNIPIITNEQDSPPFLSLSELQCIRGIDVVLMSISPFHYRSDNHQLTWLRELKVEVSFYGGSGQFGDERLRNPWWNSILDNLILNFEQLPKVDYLQLKNSKLKEEGAEYLIISPNNAEFQQWADSIKNFRMLQGILTKVATLDEIGGNSVLLIENYIDEAYNTWDTPPIAILLLGDHGTDPSYCIASPVWENYSVSDNIYADVNNDELPDIVIARICAQNSTELETMVTKFIHYEKFPPTNPGFYSQPITSCNFHASGYFQLLTESIAGFFENALGKSTNRINVGPDPLPAEWGAAPIVNDLVQFFGPNGLGYIPETPGEVNCDWNATTQDVIDGINNGSFMLLHRSQASEQGWSEPSFIINDIDNLTNMDLTFVWSPDDLIGKFDASSECFAEKLHRHTHGALGVVAASEINYGFAKEIYTWGAWDFMWPEFLPEQSQSYPGEGVYPAFANAAGKYYLDQALWFVSIQNKKVAYHTLHYFGDAFSTIYTEVPQELTIEHAGWLLEGSTTFEIMADASSLIALSINNELIAVAEGTGATQTIIIPAQYEPNEILVTVTKHNFFRYEA